MATVRNYIIFILALILGGCKDIPDVSIVPTASAQTPKEVKLQKDSIFFEKKEEAVPEKKVLPKRLTLQEIYTSQIGVREKTGKNDGKEVEMYLRSVGLGSGFSYCAAYLKWCFDSAQIKTTITAWSPTAENRKMIIYKNKKFFEEPKAGDVITFYYPKLKRVGHCGYYDSRLNDKIYVSVEANTSGAGSVGEIVRDGSGVFKKYRSFNSTHSISRWK